MRNFFFDSDPARLLAHGLEVVGIAILLFALWRHRDWTDR